MSGVESCGCLRTPAVAPWGTPGAHRGASTLPPLRTAWPLDLCVLNPRSIPPSGCLSEAPLLLSASLFQYLSLDHTEAISSCLSQALFPLIRNSFLSPLVSI